MLDAFSRGGLDYDQCYYGASRLAFRGPKATPNGDYVVALGGNATYGKFVAEPYPRLLERVTGITTINLGCLNTGATAFADDPSLMELCSGARAVVVQITGAHLNENTFFSVHPRRNDRFIDAQPKLRELFPEVDFTEFHFARHMLSALHDASPQRFQQIVVALKREWIERMHDLLRRIEAPVVLFWMADRSPGVPNSPIPEQLRYDDPLFVDRDMIDAVRRGAEQMVTAIASDDAQIEGLMGKVFAELERPAAMRFPGPIWHAEAATALYDAVFEYLPREARPRPKSRPRRSTMRASRSAQGRP